MSGGSESILTAAAEPVDAYALSAEAVERPPGGMGRALRQIGPGLILAGSIVGTGELIATTHLGAKVGFALLWLVIASCFIKVFIQAELGRNAISSGQTTMRAFRGIPMAGGVIGWWWLIMMLMTQAQLSAVVGGVGHAAHLALPGVSGAVASVVGQAHGDAGAYVGSHPDVPWAVVVALATSTVLALGGYGVIEKTSTLLVVIFTFATVLCVGLLPAAGHAIDWGEVGQGLRCTIPSTPTALAAAFAVLGLTGVGAAELVAYPYWCIEKGYARKTGPADGSADWLARARGWLRVMQLDAWCSMALYTIATVAFYFLGAAVLHGQSGNGLPNSIPAMLQSLSSMYAPVFGATAATWFIVIGAVAVLYSTLYSATGANSRATADFLHVNCGLPFRGPEARRNTVRLLVVLFPLVDLGLYLLWPNPVTMVLIGGLAQATTLPMIAAAAVYLRYRRTDRRLARRGVWDVMLWLSLIGMLVAAGYVGYDTYGRWAR